MGEDSMPDPPSGLCPGCMELMPADLPMSVELPKAGRTFTGVVGLVCDAGDCFFTAAFFCVGDFDTIGMMAWGGWLGGTIYACLGAGYHCWPIGSCEDIDFEEVVAIFKVS